MNIYLILLVALLFLLYLTYKHNRIHKLSIFKIDLIYYFIAFILISSIYTYYLLESTYPIGGGKRDGYYQQPEAYSFDEILARQMDREKIGYDKSSIRVLEYSGLVFKDLLIFSYKDQGIENVRFIEFNRSLGGRLKFLRPIRDSLVIEKNTREDLVLRDLLKKYSVSLGYGSGQEEVKDTNGTKYTIKRLPDYYMDISMKDSLDPRPLIILLIAGLVLNGFLREKRLIGMEVENGQVEKISLLKGLIYIERLGGTYENF